MTPEALRLELLDNIASVEGSILYRHLTAEQKKVMAAQKAVLVLNDPTIRPYLQAVSDVYNTE